MIKQKNKTKHPPKNYIMVCGVIAMLVLAIAITTIPFIKHEATSKVVSTALLKRFTNSNTLSTVEAIHNGIAEIKNVKNSKKTDVYVSYQAKIKAGFDFSKIKISLDKKSVIITYPPIEITDISVDEKSLDYIFQNKSLETDKNIHPTAVKACNDDVLAESNNPAILHLAKQNAENVLRTIASPFVEEFGTEYTLQIYEQESKK